MTTKLIGLKEFRLNLSAYAKEIESGNLRLIVLNKNKPVLEVNPIEIEDFTLEELRKDVARARKDYKKDKYYTIDELKERLGL
jgi:PHD/YefM family antitoxin component YafN of YafNO toxin-antitoxin module